MKTTLKTVIILLIVIQFSISANAETSFTYADSNKKISLPTLAFSLSPLYTLQNGFRVDFEFRPFKNQWIVLAPQYFIAKNKDLFFLDYGTSYGNGYSTDMEGYGFDLFHKIILKTEASISGPYAAYGIRYNTFNYKFTTGTGFVSEKHDITNTRYGFNVMFGYQGAVNNKLLLDIYTGCGIQVSNLKGDDGTMADNSEFFMNYNYTGPRFLLGFKIGLFLN
jgi:hypothetical protein